MLFDVHLCSKLGLCHLLALERLMIDAEIFCRPCFLVNEGSCCYQVLFYLLYRPMVLTPDA